MKDSLRIAVLVGEPSGDRLGAALVRALRREVDAEYFGLAGPAMQAEGVESLFPISDLAVMGLVEVLPRAPRIHARIRRVARMLESLRPDILVTVDSPDFMKRVVRRVRRRLPHTKFVNYVAPSVWVWRRRRSAEVARLYDLQLTLLPFEPAWFRSAGVRTEFVGHPAVEAVAKMPIREEARESLGVSRGRPVLLVLPGSRKGEIRRHGSVFHESVRRVVARHPDLLVLVPAAHGVEAEARRFCARCAGEARLLSAPQDAEREREKAQAFRAADVGLAVSGSVALELAVARLSGVIAYRFSPVTWLLGTMLTGHRTASLVNILAAERVQPEFIQQNCRAGPISSEILALLADEARRSAQCRAAGRAVEQVCTSGVPPSVAAARAVLSTLEGGGRRDAPAALLQGGTA